MVFSDCAVSEVSRRWNDSEDASLMPAADSSPPITFAQFSP